MTKTNAKAIANPGAISGSMTLRNTVQGPAPSMRAELSRLGSMPEM